MILGRPRHRASGETSSAVSGESAEPYERESMRSGVCNASNGTLNRPLEDIGSEPGALAVSLTSVRR